MLAVMSGNVPPATWSSSYSQSPDSAVSWPSTASPGPETPPQRREAEQSWCSGPGPGAGAGLVGGP